MRDNRIIQCLKDSSGFSMAYILYLNIILVMLVMVIINYIFAADIMLIRRVNKKKLDYACFSSANLLLSSYKKETSDPDIFPKNIETSARFLSSSSYPLIEASSYGMKDSSRFIFRAGFNLNNYFKPALSISGSYKDAAVAGNTFINGDICSATGIFRIGNLASMPQQNFVFCSGNVLVNPDISPEIFSLPEQLPLTSENNLPNISIISSDTDLNKSAYTANSLIIEGTKLSHKAKPIIIFCSGEVLIKKGTKSNLFFQISCGSLKIEDSCSISNITVKSSGKITIAQGSVFRNSGFESSSEITANSSLFIYPSSIAVFPPKKLTSGSYYTINLNGCIVNGSIILYGEPENANTRMVIDNNSSVKGIVYSNGSLEISAPVEGSVFTASLRNYIEPTEYINWLINLKIDRETLGNNFLITSGFGEGRGCLITSDRVF